MTPATRNITITNHTTSVRTKENEIHAEACLTSVAVPLHSNVLPCLWSQTNSVKGLKDETHY